MKKKKKAATHGCTAKKCRGERRHRDTSAIALITRSSSLCCIASTTVAQHPLIAQRTIQHMHRHVDWNPTTLVLAIDLPCAAALNFSWRKFPMQLAIDRKERAPAADAKISFLFWYAHTLLDSLHACPWSLWNSCIGLVIF